MWTPLLTGFLKRQPAWKKKLKLVLWQFAGNFKFTEETCGRLERFLKILPKGMGQAFEFRNSSWFHREVFDLLNKYQAGFVINDSSKFPSFDKITDGLCYIRFHGPGALYGSSYSDAELKTWAKKIKSYLKKVDVYCYFNNDGSAFAIKNAQTLKSLLARQ